MLYLFIKTHLSYILMGFLKNFIKNDTNFELFTYVLTVNKSISRKMALPLKTPLRNKI